MQRSQLHDIFRREVSEELVVVDEDAAETLITSEQIDLWIDEAYDELCRESNVWPDSSTFTLTVTADDPWATVDERIIKIRSGRLVTARRNIKPLLYEDIDRVLSVTLDYGRTSFDQRWKDDTGLPIYMITDMEEGKVRLVPIPIEADTVQLDVYRKPDPITPACTALPLRSIWHTGLIYFLKYKAFGSDDINLRTDTGKQQALAQWEDFKSKVDSDLKRERGGTRAVQGDPEGYFSDIYAPDYYGGYWL